MFQSKWSLRVRGFAVSLQLWRFEDGVQACVQRMGTSDVRRYRKA